MRTLPIVFLVACTIPHKVAGHGDGGGGDDDDGGIVFMDAAVDAPPVVVGNGDVTLSLTGKPATLGNHSDIQFTFAVDPADALVECSLDGAVYETCPPPSKTYPGTADGPHTFDLRATKGSSTVAQPQYGFTIDTAAPALTVSSKPPAYFNMTSASIVFDKGDAVSVTCQIDGANAQACASPLMLTGLAQGSHGVIITATDAATNMAVQQVTWIADTIAPTVTIGTKPAALSTVKSPVFTFSTTEGTPACTSGSSFGPFADGGHSIVVSATDLAGNYNSAGYSWTIDTTPPSAGTPSYSCSNADGTVTFTWTASDATSGIASGTCNYNGTVYDCTNIRTLLVGQQLSGKTFFTTYTDAAGNSRSSLPRTVNLGTLCD